MLARFGPFLCGGLLLASLASTVSAQTPDVQPEVFTCTRSKFTAVPRLIEELKSQDQKVRDKAIVTLGSFGAIAQPAAPALVEVAVNTPGHALALQALAKIDEQATLTALRRLLVGGRGRCKCGNRFIDVVSSGGEPIVPHLIKLTAEKDHAANAGAVLVQIGAPAVPHLVRNLEARDDATRLGMANVLFQIGDKARAAIPALEKRLAVEKGTVRLHVAQALYRVNGGHQTAFDVLHDAVRADDKAQQLDALQCLLNLQCKAKELIPTMMSVVATSEHHSYAFAILTTIGPDAVPALIAELSKQDGKHTASVLYTLSNIGPGAAPAIPNFITILNGKDRALAVQAADLLPNLGPDAKSAIPHLLAALNGNDHNLRIVSAQSLVRMDKVQAKHAIAPLVEVLRGDNVNDRQRALWLLNGFGADAKPAVPALVEMLKSEKLPMRISVAHVLLHVDPSQADAVLPTVMEALQPKKEHIPQTRQAINLLAKMGPRGKTAIPAVKELLQQTLKNQVRGVNSYSLVDCLRQMDASGEAMAVLIGALNSKDVEEREDAAYAITDTIGRNALPAITTAVANGSLRDTPELASLVKQLRKQAGANQ
jgi:HEAT repeat protein